MSYREELGLEEIRSLAIKALKNFKDGKSEYGHNIQITTLILEIAHEAVNAGLKKSSDSSDYAHMLSDKEHDRAREVITNLITEGVIMWGLNRHNPQAPFMGITEYGNKVFDAGEMIPHDPDGYLSNFKKNVPQANDLMLKYLTESIQTYRHNHLLASSVMLGVASEAAFDVLFAQLQKTLTDSKKIVKFEKLEKDVSLKNRFDGVMNEIAQFKKLLPKELEENIEFNITSVFTLIRQQRNDTGHPTGKDVKRDDMFVMLRLFITYCTDLYKLIEWLKSNPLWEATLKGQ